MATNLYETLGLSRNATPEEIRKAYRRKALETHPDRLPQGASAAEKAASEEMFRKVNNAYEVLSDPQNRQTYDQHGVWPPPTSGPAPQNPFHARNMPFASDPFFQDPFFTRSGPFGSVPGFGGMGGFPGFGSSSPFPHGMGFTDPFVLFNSVFGDLQRAFADDPFFSMGHQHRAFGGADPFGGMTGMFGGGAVPSVFPALGAGSGGDGRRWISKSWSSHTVNGVTHAKCVRRDSDGNEHVIYKLPDGTERRTINGVEQPTSHPPRALLPNIPAAPMPPTTSNIPPAINASYAPPPTPPNTSNTYAHPYSPTTNPNPNPNDRVYPPPPSYEEITAQPPIIGQARSSGHRDHGHARRGHGHGHESYPGDRREGGYGYVDRREYGHGHGHREREKARAGYEAERGGQGQNGQGERGSSWKFWKDR
ncbi:hypothetical protein HYDPIDRAFT_115184 [Hydnomerulius pinastri MD-312]|uniref:J domain-containing protein n=1 Tax=Hydnomerulius pinastri MD-312 TaxID=994086 RepID=A0A0C9V8I9_9AGAM|nr:hypothetical protein HYDPIDRAFT_115184 [Hydnomerulius pinastri MD-312]